LEPLELPERIELLRRFHIGSSSVNLTMATKPQELLAALQVCKKWHVWGCHLFYGQNRFAFSSLGEWGRFAKGIGSRLQRVQHIELLWVGSQHLTSKPTLKGKTTSRRTLDLIWLAEAIRLKTIKIHLRESDRGFMRRPYEPPRLIEHMKQKTAAQANFRLFRSFRTLQGLDYLLCLRGLESVEFFDHDQWLTSQRIIPVRDFTFVMDVNNAVRREKQELDHHMSQIRNLAPTIKNYNLSIHDWAALEAVLSGVKDPKVSEIPGDGAIPVGTQPEVIVLSDDETDNGHDEDVEDDVIIVDHEDAESSVEDDAVDDGMSVEDVIMGEDDQDGIDDDIDMADDEADGWEF
jgi:hypothetical protein